MNKGIVRKVKLGTQVTLLCGPSEKRDLLLISPPPVTSGGDYYTISTEPDVVIGEGLNINANSTPFTISAAVHGDAVTRAWYAIATATMKIGLLETVSV
jgi:hypothetical protein